MFIKQTGAGDVEYRSKAEARISHKLYQHGIASHDEFYPISFTDSKNYPFRAKSDFMCIHTGIYFEFKSGPMNGLKNTVNARKAEERLRKDKATGYINEKNESIKVLEASWSNSVAKFAAVQNQVAEVNRCVVLIFDKMPPLETEKRLEKAMTFWCVYGDKTFNAFMSFRTFAMHGVPVTYHISGHVFTANQSIDCRTRH